MPNLRVGLILGCASVVPPAADFVEGSGIWCRYIVVVCSCHCKEQSYKNGSERLSTWKCAVHFVRMTSSYLLFVDFLYVCTIY